MYGGGTVGLMGTVARTVLNGKLFSLFSFPSLLLSFPFPFLSQWFLLFEFKYLVGGGKVMGVIPKALSPKEISSEMIGDVTYL